MLRVLSRSVRRFRREEGGYMVIEAALILPFLLWAYLALYTYWDTYRAMTNSQKASYTISDMISREQVPVDAAYIDGMRRTMDYVMGGGLQSVIRVSSVRWSELNGRFEIEWSSSTSPATKPALTTDTLQPLASRIPAMVDGDTVVLVETTVPYQPSLDVGLPDQTFEEFIVTRPRFAPRIVFEAAL